MRPQPYLPTGEGFGGRSGAPQEKNSLFNYTTCEKITSFVAGHNVGIIDRKGCIGLARHAWDRSLCARERMCPKCNEIAAARKSVKYHRIIDDEFQQSKEYGPGWELRVDVLTTTLPGKQHWVRHESLRDQYNYITERTNVKGIGGDHSMRGLNHKLKEWGYYGGAHFIEFTWNKHRKWWNVHNHTIAVGFANDVSLPEKLKETSRKEWTGLRYEKEPYVDHGGFTNEFKEIGLGRRYSLDKAEHHEVADCIGYVAKLAYVTKPVKAPAGKRKELRTFFAGLDGKKPHLTRPWGDWCKSRVWSEPI